MAETTHSTDENSPEEKDSPAAESETPRPRAEQDWSRSEWFSVWLDLAEK